jgi:outer membrane protein OmpA-like peptidoglycan-associated protein/lipoprotein NlpI
MYRILLTCLLFVCKLFVIGVCQCFANESAMVSAIKLYEKKKYEKALRLLDSIIAKDPYDVEARNNRGLNYAGLGKFAAARADYEAVLRINPRHAKAINNRGFLHFTMGQIDSAMTDYHHALTINPRLAKAYNNRGVAKFSRMNFDGAVADYDTAIRIDPTLAEAFLNRGTANYSLGKVLDAKNDYHKAVEIDPEYADAYFGRGVTKYALGDKSGACSDWNHSFAMGFTKDADIVNKICLPPRADLKPELNPTDFTWVSRLRILTEKNQSEILPEYMEVIEKVVSMLRAYPGMQVEIQGHADSINRSSDKDLNRKLSLKRADAVKSAIIEAGIATSRLKAVGYGDTRPVEPNDTEEGRAQNRRIEFIITKID